MDCGRVATTPNGKMFQRFSDLELLVGNAVSLLKQREEDIDQSRTTHSEQRRAGVILLPTARCYPQVFRVKYVRIVSSSIVLGRVLSSVTNKRRLLFLLPASRLVYSISPCSRGDGCYRAWIGPGSGLPSFKRRNRIRCFSGQGSALANLLVCRTAATSERPTQISQPHASWGFCSERTVLI
ncbi:hypothetical protein M431DRAFT_414632 [Trichoderma harzianum CBS 226.95]|jgi:hypothetical protein|uniref:Uncharacterized protein n=1 Tax=Trichoderma harzianum CBS 226.95 TaxID=983964 RepID=A0A2T4AFW1_TRIHA|nr:hypothetical protein M431DRAFT_414632 [Trichoderma harzianum CBS 226.95]PTB55969.1 hypothetical protein M431DRAFT_414632 [Trichoderma harzianum CBS 226.95]